MFSKNKLLIQLLGCTATSVFLIACSEQDPVDVKLNAQLEKYDQAKELIIERNFHENNPISRDEWEAHFVLDESNEFCGSNNSGSLRFTNPTG